MFSSLFWKEYRQQRAVVLALVIFHGLIQLSWSVWASISPYNIPVPLYGTAVFITALFAASSTAIVFCNEHDEKTFDVLRNQPVPGTLVAAAKIAWCLCATVLVLVGTLLFSACFHLFQASTSFERSELLLGVTGLGACEGFVWGLFWSTRRKKQFEALLATYICTSGGMYLAAWFYDLCFTIRDPFFPGVYVEAIPFRLVILILVSIFAVYGACGWLRKMESQNPSQSPPRKQGIAHVFTYLNPCLRNGLCVVNRSPFASLCWITFQQSKLLILYALGVHLLIAATLWPYWKFFADVERAVEPDQVMFMSLFVLGTLSILVFCGSVFWNDHKSNGTKLLIHSGVSPAKIWWSRTLVFGTVYLIPAAILHLPLFVMTITCTPGLNHSLAKTILFAFAIYLSPFCLGLFCSLAIRRGILAVFATGLTFILFFVIGCHWINFILDCSPFWTTIPMLLAIAAASRLRVNNWAKNRDTFRAWRLPLAVIAVPAVCILIAIPPVRVYSVPIIDYGYNMEIPSPADADILRTIVKNDAGEYFRDINPQLPFKLEQTYSSYDEKYYNSGSKTFDLESLRRDIAELSQPDKELQVVWRARIRNSYKEDADWIKSANGQDFFRGYHVAIPSLLGRTPWERTRALRLLNNEFQRTMQYFDRLWRAMDENERIFHEASDGLFVGLKSGSVFDSFESWYFSTYAFRDPWMTPFDLGNAIKPNRRGTLPFSSLYSMEQNRRVSLIVAALEAWKLEHGSYPDTLKLLEGTYLQRIPCSPLYEMPYIYHVNESNGTAFLLDARHDTLLWDSGKVRK